MMIAISKILSCYECRSRESNILRRRRILKNVMALTLLVVLGSLLAWAGLILRMQRAAFLKSQIVAFEKSDSLNPPKPGAIVFTGSSSIRYWKTLEKDMAPLPVVN